MSKHRKRYRPLSVEFKAYDPFTDSFVCSSQYPWRVMDAATGFYSKAYRHFKNKVAPFALFTLFKDFPRTPDVTIDIKRP